MTYLERPDDITTLIAELATYPILWLDTETAEWWTPHPKLSLIQALANPDDTSGKHTYILDVLHQPDLAEIFIATIMAVPQIEKVFHNASYDLRFLGGVRAQNVTCTLKLARSIPRKTLTTTNRKLKTLAHELCGFDDVDAEPQSSDWGRRPLSDRQLQYARMDTVYLAHVHRQLLYITQPPAPSPIRSQPTAKAPVLLSVASPSVTVNQVRVAVECPRLFYLAKQDGGPTMFRRDGQAGLGQVGLGKVFHDLSGQLVKTALHDPSVTQLLQPHALKTGSIGTAAAANVAAELQTLGFSLVFYPYLHSIQQTAPEQVAALLPLWQALKRLIQQWAMVLVRNRRYCKATEAIAKTFLAQNLTLQHSFTLPNGAQQIVRGRFDRLVYDVEQRRICLVDYEIYPSPDVSAHPIQIALYSYLLRQTTGVPIDSATYTVFPDGQELTLSWQELENILHHQIPQTLQQMQTWMQWQPHQPNAPTATRHPQLCDLCPQRSRCQTVFGQPQT